MKKLLITTALFLVATAPMLVLASNFNLLLSDSIATLTNLCPLGDKIAFYQLPVSDSDYAKGSGDCSDGNTGSFQDNWPLTESQHYLVVNFDASTPDTGLDINYGDAVASHFVADIGVVSFFPLSSIFYSLVADISSVAGETILGVLAFVGLLIAGGWAWKFIKRHIGGDKLAAMEADLTRRNIEML